MDVDVWWLKKLNYNFPKPDLTIIIDVPESVSIDRVKRTRPMAELFEEEQKLKRIRENYKNLSQEFQNTVTIDGTKSIGEVSGKIKSETIYAFSKEPVSFAKKA